MPWPCGLASVKTVVSTVFLALRGRKRGATSCRSDIFEKSATESIEILEAKAVLYALDLLAKSELAIRRHWRLFATSTRNRSS
jgi:hypothetical protein